MTSDKQKQTQFRLTEDDHRNLKILAAKEKKTLSEIILKALDTAFPGWRKRQ